jgi:hypothetical protein
VSDNFEVKNDSIAKIMKDIGGRIHSAIADGELKGKLGFALLIFEFGEGGALFYISDAKRDEMVNAFKEFIAKQEKADD